MKKPALIIVDVLQRIKPPGRSTQTSYESDYAALADLQQWATAHGVSVLVLHHTRKRGAHDPLEALSGSNGLSACADTTLMLDRTSAGITLYMRGRDVDEKETALRFENGLFSILGDTDEWKRSGERSAILSEAHKAELTALETRIARQTFLDDAERRMEGTPLAGGGDDRFETALREFSLRRAILSQVSGHGEDCARERELSQELARRAGRPFQGIAVPMTVFRRPIERRTVTSTDPSGGPGGSLIATDLLAGDYIDLLRARLVIRRLGARVLSGLVGNVDIPTQKAASTSGWVVENSALTLSDPQFDKVSLRPRHAGCLTEFSRNMLLQSSPDIEMLLRSDFAAVLAQAIDRVAIQGAGANEPSGVLDAVTANSTSMSPPPTWTGVLELIEAVEIADSEGVAWLTHPSVVRALRSTARVSGTDSVMIQQDPNTLAGYPLSSTTLTPDLDSTGYPLIFGNWSDLLLGYWSELDILVNPFESSAYSKGNVQVRGMVTADVAIRHVESFSFCESVAT